ncbi:MAG: VOC family protein [Acetobacteraceae bacterium]|nr:VOC family protein [Acetobacteraceae bacterium]
MSASNSPGLDHALGLDHVGIAGADLSALAATYEKLGFQLTPLARHAGKRTQDGPVVPFGTGNRCIMLRQGYLELIAIVDPGAFSNTLDRFLARYAGIHIIALNVADADSNLARLRRAGFDVPGIAYLERPVDDADPTGPRAKFARLPLPDAPEGRIQLIQHLTPEAIWQERFLSHPNSAVALEDVVLVVADSAEAAARFSRLAGQPVVPDPMGGFSLDLPHGRVRLVAENVLEKIFPGVVAPVLPYVAGVSLRTFDQNAAIVRIAAAHSIATHPVSGGLLIPPAAAGGAALRFLA